MYPTTFDLYTNAGVIEREQRIAAHLVQAQRRNAFRQEQLHARRRHGPGLRRLIGQAIASR